MKRGIDIDILSLYKPTHASTSALPEKLGFDKNISYAPDLNKSAPIRLFRIFLLSLRLLFQGRGKAVKKLFTDNKTRSEISRHRLMEIALLIEKSSKDTDLLFCHFGPVGRLAAILKHYHLIDKKIITSFHGYDISRYVQENPKGIYDVLFQQSNMLICVSDYFLEKMIKLGAPKEISHVVHTAIDCSKFEYSERHIKDSETIKFISVGRFTEKKGHEYLLKAFQKLVQNGAYKVHLDLIGEGELFDEMKALANDLSIDSHVTFHGALQHSEVLATLQNAHIFVLPSIVASDGDMEGIPGSIMEAMALGLPVVSTYHTGVPELVSDGLNGFLTVERDIDGLYTKMAEVIEKQDQWKNMTKLAREKVEQDFEREKESDKLLKLLETL